MSSLRVFRRKFCMYFNLPMHAVFPAHFAIDVIITMARKDGRQERKVKLPIYRHISAKGERKYSSCSFLTLALDGGKWSASRHGRAFPRGKDPRYPLDRRLGGPQSWFGHRGLIKSPLPLPGIEPRSFSL
jgi:hypothetical protein